ncbi:serine endoprotease DegQ [Alphaproteobacteria bacterium]|nr:serine endoprotease DegQ [Alphaproteobacteria bacterium]GHS96309.1 serine endoprotease DegQ [Alphaproteobacteria bacterium]
MNLLQILKKIGVVFLFLSLLPLDNQARAPRNETEENAPKPAPKEAPADTEGCSGKTYSVPQIVKNSVPAVVTIQASSPKEVLNPYGDPLFDFFFGPTRMHPSVRRSSGSGFIVDPRGYVVTCAHVVEGAQTIRVTLDNEVSFKAVPVLVDPSLDLAVLKLETPKNVNLPYLPLANVDPLVGDSVVAIGNAFSLGQTVTHGIVSAIYRVFDARVLFQTDAPINPGNSGGPILNDRGEVIGVANAIASRSGASHGVGFFIPSIAIRHVLGRATDAKPAIQIPLKVQTLDSSVLETLATKGISTRGGCIVEAVLDDSLPLSSGDILLSVAGKPVWSKEMFDFFCRLVDVGQRYAVTIIHSKDWSAEHPKIHSVYIKATPEKTLQDITKNTLKIEGKTLLSGMVVAELTPELAAYLGIKDRTELKNEATGVVVLESSANTDLFQKKDIILEINGQGINSLSDFQKAAQSINEKSRTLSFKIRRGNALLSQSFRF